MTAGVRKWTGLVAVVVAGALLSACRVVADDPEGLGTLSQENGPWAQATSVNDGGVVVGISGESGSTSAPGEAFRFDPDDGAMTPLGTLVAGQRSVAVDVNNRDVAVGSAWVWGDAAVYEMERAVVFDPTDGLVDLHASLGSWDESGATAVNDDGVVVGWAHRYFSIHFPTVVARLNFAYDLRTGVLTPLPVRPADINRHGLVVGTSNGRAASFDLTTGTFTDLGTLGGDSSSAVAVNDHGVVVGDSQRSDGQFRAFRYDSSTGEMIEIGTLGGDLSLAVDVNELNHIIGISRRADGVERGFFQWSVDGSMIELPELEGSVSWAPSRPEALSNRNVVVGATPVVPAGETAWRLTVRVVGPG